MVRTKVHFSDRPISRIDDLYGEAHKEAVGKVYSAVEEGHFIAILGARRVGKTRSSRPSSTRTIIASSTLTCHPT